MDGCIGFPLLIFGHLGQVNLVYMVEGSVVLVGGLEVSSDIMGLLVVDRFTPLGFTPLARGLVEFLGKLSLEGYWIWSHAARGNPDRERRKTAQDDGTEQVLVSQWEHEGNTFTFSYCWQ